MTWLGDTTNKLSDEERQRLIAERADLVLEIKELKEQLVPRTQAAKRFKQEDLMNLAKAVLKIDEKLGRNVHSE